VSIDEVMQEAGLTRTLFYRHFDDLADLVVKVAAPVFDELYALETRLAEVDADGGVDARAALLPAVETFARHAPLVRAIAEAASHDREVDRVYRGVMDRYVAMTAGAFERLQPAARLTDPQRTARALTLMNLQFLIETFGGPEPTMTPDAALDTISEIWERVLRTG
jgi:AcrR family transcriptional regulator